MFKINKKLLKKNKLLIFSSLLCFFIFFVLYRIVPMTYDGWASKFAYPSTGGIINYIYYLIFECYFYTNGRLVSNFICGILESFTSEIPLDFFNALCILIMYIFIYLICKKKNGDQKKFFFGILLFSGLILLVSPPMRTEVLFYANSAYIVPIPFFLIYYYLLQKVIDDKFKGKKILILMSVISFSIGMWMEHISFGFAAVISLITIIQFIKKNKNRFKLLIPNIFAIAGFLLMMLSPGLKNNREIVSSSPLIETLANNIKSIYVDIVSQNTHLFFILFLLIAFIIFTKKKKKHIDYIMGTISSVISGIFLVAMIYKTFFFSSLEFINTLFPPTYYSAEIIPIIISILVMLPVIIFSIFKVENKELSLYVFGIGILCLLPMLITPNTGARISSIGFFALVIISVIYFYELNDFRLIKGIIITLFIIALDHTILLGRRINDVTEKRDRILQTTLEKQEMNEFDYSCYIAIPIYEANDMFRTGAISQETVHYDVFLEAYQLDRRTKVLFYNHNISALKQVCIENDKIVFKTDVDKDEKIKLKINYGDSYNTLETIIDTDWLNEDYSIEAKKGYYIVDSYYNNGIDDQVITDHFELYID